MRQEDGTGSVSRPISTLQFSESKVGYIDLSADVSVRATTCESAACVLMLC